MFVDVDEDCACPLICFIHVWQEFQSFRERERVGVREWEWESWRTVMRNKIEFIILPPSPITPPHPPALCNFLNLSGQWMPSFVKHRPDNPTTRGKLLLQAGIWQTVCCRGKKISLLSTQPSAVFLNASIQQWSCEWDYVIAKGGGG